MKCRVFFIALSFMELILLASCEQSKHQPNINPLLPTSDSSASMIKPTYTWTTVPSDILPTTSKLINYQLTFITDGENIYGMDVDCLKSNQLCFGKKKLIVTIQERHIAPVKPVVYHSWDYDGDKLAICATGMGDRDEIFWANLDDLQWTNITKSNAIDCSPIWTPDGSRIVYETSSQQINNGHKIYSVLLNGQQPIQLLGTNRFGDEGMISLSPDGNHIAYIHSDDHGFYQLFIANLDGSNRVQLTDLSAHNYSPSFSPDGKWLVFQRHTDPYSTTNQSDASRKHLVIMNIETKKEITLLSGNNEFEDFSFPTWAPFGQWIAFNSNISGNYDIYIIRIDGSGLTKVTSGNGFEGDPKWRIYYSP